MPGIKQAFAHLADDPQHPCRYQTVYDYRVRARYLEFFSPGWSYVDSGYRVTLAPPVVVLTAHPLSGQPALDVSFYAAGSYDPDGGLLALYEWDWDGDGVYDMDSGTNSSVMHSYSQSGLYAATVRATDDEGETATASVTLNVNFPPVAQLTADPLHGAFPLSVNFDASASTDRDGVIASYAFDFGDGAGWVDNGASPLVAHTYTVERAYNARVRVTDDDGAQAVSAALVLGDLYVWRMYGHDPQHTGRSPYRGAQSQHYHMLFDIDHNFVAPVVIGPGGTAYFGGKDKNLYAVSAAGTLLWSVATDGMILSSPALSLDNILYATSMDGNLYAIDASGARLWTFPTGAELQSSPVIGPAGTIYICGDRMVYALNPDGTLQWSYPTADSVVSTPALDTAGTVFVSSVDCGLYAIHSDGALKWRFSADHALYSTPSIGADGTVYFGDISGTYYAIDPDGALKWTLALSSINKTGSAIAADGTVYVISRNGWCYAVNPDGTLKWSLQTNLEQPTGSPAVGADGKIYVSGYRGVIAVSPDGSALWQTGTNSSAPVIGYDDTLYVAMDFGIEYFCPDN